MAPLRSLTVPCGIADIEGAWRAANVFDRLRESVQSETVKLPPAHLGSGERGVLEDLTALGLFEQIADGRMNMPDVYRVGYGMGRKGGVKPVER